MGMPSATKKIALAAVTVGLVCTAGLSAAGAAAAAIADGAGQRAVITPEKPSPSTFPIVDLGPRSDAAVLASTSRWASTVVGPTPWW